MKNSIKLSIILLIIMSFFVASCDLAPSPDICVSIPPQAWLVKRLAGEDTPVTVMIPPGSAPPTYAPTASQVRDLQECKLYIKNGHPDFTFEKKHIDPYLKEHPEVLTVNMAKGLDIVPGDAHIWLSPGFMNTAAPRIYEQLVKLYPERRDELKANLVTLQRDILKLDTELRNELTPYQGKKFLTLHPSWGYFARDYGLQQVSIRHEHKAPSAQEMAHLIEHAKEENIHIIFVQKEFAYEQLSVIAKAIDGEIVALDPLNIDWLKQMQKTGSILAKVFNEQ
jgi:zinc transport system substrate-binding protein